MLTLVSETCYSSNLERQGLLHNQLRSRKFSTCESERNETALTVIELNDENFDEVLKGAQLPILVDFWAPWCGPCTALAPVLDALSEEHGSTFAVGKVNIDGNPATASKWGVMSLPTLMLFRNGEPLMTAVGLAPKSEIQREVLEHITP
jgi:thioredoxin 1